MTGLIVWITGLSGSGKSSTARAFAEVLKTDFGQDVVQLDGDAIRDVVKESGLIGEFSYEGHERRKWAHLYSGLASLFGQQGHLVVVSTISMFSETYEVNRRTMPKYYEVFLDIPMATIKERDSRGYYAGEIANLSGVDIPIDKPTAAHMVIADPSKSPEEIAALIVVELKKENYL